MITNEFIVMATLLLLLVVQHILIWHQQRQIKRQKESSDYWQTSYSACKSNLKDEKESNARMRAICTEQQDQLKSTRKDVLKARNEAFNNKVAYWKLCQTAVPRCHQCGRLIKRSEARKDKDGNTVCRKHLVDAHQCPECYTVMKMTPHHDPSIAQWKWMCPNCGKTGYWNPIGQDFDIDDNPLPIEG